MTKIFKTVVAGLLVFFLFVIFVFLRMDFVTSLKYYDQDIKIERDQFNIPSIRAPSLRSALYAWGYVQAEDRLFQLAFRRASVKGQLCQYLGQRALDIDKMFRQINLYGWAVKSAQRLLKENATQYDNFKAFGQGISDYFKSLTFKPLEFYMTGMKWEQWTVADTFGLYKLLKWSLSFGMADEYIRSTLLKNFTKQQVDGFLPYQPKYWLKGEYAKHTTIIKDNEIPQKLLERSKQMKFENFKPVSVEQMQSLGYFQYLDINQRASNSWAISGKHTDTGYPLLCNDPHLDSALPGQWYQIKIFYRGLNGKQVYAIGGSAIGMPLIVGKTTYGAVSITTNYIDSQDLFKEKIEGNKYYLDGEWRQLKIRNQTINIKGSNPIHYIIQQTHRGPLIKHIGSKGYLYKTTEPVSLAWTGFTDAEYLSLVPYIHMGEVKNYNQMQSLLAECTDYGPPFNLVYITRDNHIGYSSIGVIPIRKNHQAGMYVKDGTNSENDWVGFIKGSDKLNLHDPQRGYIVTANNKAASDKYFNGVLDSSPFTGRANRLEQLIEKQLAAGRKLSKDFMRKLQLDTVDTYCLQVMKGMKQKLATGDLTYKFIFYYFENFDCNFSSTSTASSYYLTLIQNIYEQIHPEGKDWTFILSNFLPFHQYIYRFILKEHSQKELKQLNTSMLDSLKQLKTFYHSYHPQAYKYGQLHKDLMIHRPFSYVPYLKMFFEHEGPGFGNWNTPNVAHMNKFHEKDYRTNHRANMRLIMSYFENSQWIIDGGSNQKFYSRHYKDQMDLFMNGKYIVMDPWNRTTDII